MSRVYILGSINVDINCVVEKFPTKGLVEYASNYSYNLGGKATSVAVGLRNLGNNPTLVSSIGKDIFSDYILGQLSFYRLSARYIERQREFPTRITFGMVNAKGRNCRIVSEGANDYISTNLIEKATKKIGKNDHFYFTTEIPQPAIQYALDAVYKKADIIICDAGPNPERIRKLLKKIDIVIMNRKEAMLLSRQKIFGRRSLESVALKIRKMKAKTIIITLGSKGVYMLPDGNDKGLICDPVHVNVTDPTGAGDAFRAAFIDNYLKTGNIAEALYIANYAGAYAVTQLGSTSALPNKRQLQKFIKSVI